MPTYTVVTPLKTGDGMLEPGEPVELKAKEARELLAAGVISKPALALPAPAPKDPSSGDSSNPNASKGDGKQSTDDGGASDTKDGGDPPQT